MQGGCTLSWELHVIHFKMHTPFIKWNIFCYYTLPAFKLIVWFAINQKLSFILNSLVYCRPWGLYFFNFRRDFLASKQRHLFLEYSFQRSIAPTLLELSAHGTAREGMTGITCLLGVVTGAPCLRTFENDQTLDHCSPQWAQPPRISSKRLMLLRPFSSSNWNQYASLTSPSNTHLGSFQQLSPTCCSCP